MTNQVISPEKRLEELGYKLQTPRKPIGNYVSCVRTGNLILLRVRERTNIGGNWEKIAPLKKVMMQPGSVCLIFLQ